jgi:hypothetical protein
MTPTGVIRTTSQFRGPTSTMICTTFAGVATATVAPRAAHWFDGFGLNGSAHDGSAWRYRTNQPMQSIKRPARHLGMSPT